MKILVADDEPTYSALLQAVLSASGYDVVVARDGREAWEALTPEDAPQLAVLDWSMPRMDGIDICRRAREDVRKRFLYILLLTGRNREEDLIEATEAGADDFFTKTFNMSEFLLRVNAGRRIIELQNQLSEAGENVAAQAVEIETATSDLEHAGDLLTGKVLAAMESIASHAKKLEEICGTEQCRFYSRDIYEIIRSTQRSILTVQKSPFNE